MEDLLGTLIKVAGGAAAGGNGGQSSTQSGTQSADLIGELLGGLLGGQSSASSQPAAAGGLGSLLEMVLGGGAGNIFGSASGGQSPLGMANPLAEMLAEKTGLSPMIANAIVAFFLAKFMAPSEGSGSTPSQQGGLAGGLNLDHMLDMMDNDDAIDSQLNAAGMPQELAKAAGIDEKTAAQGLSELMKILGGQRVSPKPVTTRHSDLKGLLDTWQTD